MADADYDLGGGYDHPEAGTWDAAAPAAGSSLRRYANLAGALCSLALLIGAGVWGYNLALRDVQGVPVILALDGPMRVLPEDPGGEIVDYQGLAVNDVAAEGLATPLPDRLILAPRPTELNEEDMAGLPGLAEDAVLAPAVAVTGSDGPVLAAEPPSESASPTEVAIDAALAEALGEAPIDLEADPALELAAVETLDPEVETAADGAMTSSLRPKSRPAKGAGLAAAMATSSAAEIDPTTIPVGTRLVQFGAYDTEDEARAEWIRLEGRFGEVMAGKSMVLQPAESGGRTFIRLRAHGFEDEDDARRFCVAFTAKGLVCIPVPQR